jgi:hypothetical protein
MQAELRRKDTQIAIKRRTMGLDSFAGIFILGPQESGILPPTFVAWEPMYSSSYR